MKDESRNRIARSITGGLIVALLLLAAPAGAEGWGRPKYGRGGAVAVSAGDSLAAFYDYGYIPNAAVPGQLLNFGQPKVLTSAAWTKIVTVASTANYPCGIVTDLWLNPAPDTDSAGWTQQERSYHFVMWEVMLVSFDQGNADTLTERMAGDSTIVGGGVPYGAWLGSFIWPRETYDNGLAQVTSVLAWGNGTYSRTLVVRLYDLGIEYTDSVQIWLRPATEPWQRYRLRLYGSVESVLLPSKSLLTGRRFGIVYNSKRPWRHDLVNYIRLVNKVPVESYVRQWSALKMGSFHIAGQRPWQSEWPYGDSTHSPVYGKKDFMEENLFVFVDSLPQVAYLDSILPNAANDTVWLKAPARSWGYREGQKYETAAALNHAFFLRPGEGRYDPRDTTLWVTTATRYDTTGGIWKYRVTNTADAENEVRSRGELVKDSAFAWLCGNPARYYTGFEDPASGYYGSSRGYGDKGSVYKLLFDVGTDSAAYASWGFTLNEEALRFRSGIQISSMKCLPGSDSVSWHERSCVVYYTRDLLAGNTPVEWPAAGRCCWGEDVCSDVTEAECEALNGEWLAEKTCESDPCAAAPEGRCCFADYSCEMKTEASCLFDEGTWDADSSCTANHCTTHVPFDTTVIAAADNYLSQSYKDNNCGGYVDTMYAGYLASADSNFFAMVYFNLSMFATSGSVESVIVNSAACSLFQVIAIAGTAWNLGTRKVLQDWFEGNKVGGFYGSAADTNESDYRRRGDGSTTIKGATITNGDTAWSGPFYSASIYDSVSIETGNRWLVFSGAGTLNLVRSWVDTLNTNYGILLRRSTATHVNQYLYMRPRTSANTNSGATPAANNYGRPRIWLTGYRVVNNY